MFLGFHSNESFRGCGLSSGDSVSPNRSRLCEPWLWAQQSLLASFQGLLLTPWPQDEEFFLPSQVLGVLFKVCLPQPLLSPESHDLPLLCSLV